MKRARKPARKTLSSLNPPLSTSTYDSPEIETPAIEEESEDEEASNGPSTTIESRETKKRRRHLDPGDVGRFATLAIDQHAPPPNRGSSSLSATYFPVELPTNTTPEVKATSVEEPEDPDDVDMRARRGPTTHQNRFYVTSLSDESEDEDAEGEQKRQDRIDAAIASSPIDAQPDGSFVVNGELINRLQVLESHRRHALARDRAFNKRHDRDKNSDDSGSSTPTGPKKQQGALILWKSPKELSKEIQMHAEAPVITVQDDSPPVVIEDGDYACVRRSTSPFLFEKNSSTAPPAKSADEMELDFD